MAIALRCRCGNVRGEVDLARAYTRGTCYCRDCQGYLRFLERNELMDRCVGTDIVPMSPAGVRIIDGMEHVACVSMSDKGILRWYAACCRTPLGNTPRSAKVAYVGMVATCFDAPAEAVDSALGPRDRVVLNAGSATCKVRSTPIAFFHGGLRIAGNILAARFRPPTASPFFDSGGRRIREPEVMTAEQRAALGANPG